MQRRSYAVLVLLALALAAMPARALSSSSGARPAVRGGPATPTPISASPTVTATTSPTVTISPSVGGGILTATRTPARSGVTLTASPTVRATRTALATATTTATRIAARTRVVDLLANGGFETGSLRPWQRSGTPAPRVVKQPHHRGHYAVLIGRTGYGSAASSLLTVRLAIPARARSVTLSLYAWQRCMAVHPHSRLTLTVADATRAKKTATRRTGTRRSLPRVVTVLNGCAHGASWSALKRDLTPLRGRTVTITIGARLAEHEAAALAIDDVRVAASLPLTPTATPTASTTPTETATATPAGTPTPTATSTVPPTPTDVPNVCAAPAIGTAYAAALPTMTPTRTPRPTSTAMPAPFYTPTPTQTPLWRRSPTPTPTATGTPAPTPGYTMTPGPSPTVGTACHMVVKGISYGFLTTDGGPTSAATPIAGPDDAGALMATGARSVRVDFHLAHDDSWTPAEYSAYDVAINAFAARGLDVLAMVGPDVLHHPDGPNTWLADSYEQSGGDGDNPFIRRYAAQVAALVARYHDRIHTWELWNEPNVGRPGASNYLYPSNFAALLADTYALVKASYPDVTIVSGGLLSQDEAGNSNSRNAGADYLRQTYHMGLDVTHSWDTVRARFHTTPLDAIGQHLYVDQGGLVYTRHIADAYRWMHQAYADFGDGAKPIYMTEGAWTTAAVSQQTQMLDLDMLYSMSENPAFPYVERVYWYLLRDDSSSRQYYGLEAPDGTTKQAWGHFRGLY